MGSKKEKDALAKAFWEEVEESIRHTPSEVWDEVVAEVDGYLTCQDCHKSSRDVRDHIVHKRLLCNECIKKIRDLDS